MIGEMAQGVDHSLCEHGNLGLDLQNTHGVGCSSICNLSTPREMGETGESLNIQVALGTRWQTAKRRSCLKKGGKAMACS